MKQGRHQQGHLITGKVGVDEHVEAVPGDVAMTEHGALGLAGGAGRVHDEAGIVQRHRLVDRIQRAGGEQGLVVRVRLDATHGGVDRDQMTHPEPGSDPVDNRGLLRCVHQHRGARVGQIVGKFRPGQSHVERDEDRAEHAHGEERLQQRRVVRPKVGHPIPAAHAEAPQAVREPDRALVQLPIGPLTVAEAHGHAVGRLAGPSRRPRPDSLVAHSDPLSPWPVRAAWPRSPSGSSAAPPA